MCLLTLLRCTGKPGNVPLVVMAEVRESKFSGTNAVQAFGSVTRINILLAKASQSAKPQVKEQEGRLCLGRFGWSREA